MKIWKKIILGFITVISIMIAVNYYSIRNNFQVIDQIKVLEISKRVELNQSNKIAYLIQRIKSNIREIFLEIEEDEEPNEIIRARKIIEDNLPTLQNALRTLKEATNTDHQFFEEDVSEIGELKELELIDSLCAMISIFESSIQKSLSLLDENEYSLAKAVFEDNAEGISINIQDLIMLLVKDAEEEVYSIISRPI